MYWCTLYKRPDCNHESLLGTNVEKESLAIFFAYQPSKSNEKYRESARSREYYDGRGVDTIRCTVIVASRRHVLTLVVCLHIDSFFSFSNCHKLVINYSYKYNNNLIVF